MAENHRLTANDDNKENEHHVSKLTKIETDLKNYESLVTKLNKLSAEEEKIRSKLFTHYRQVCFNLYYLFYFQCIYIFILLRNILNCLKIVFLLLHKKITNIQK